MTRALFCLLLAAALAPVLAPAAHAQGVPVVTPLLGHDTDSYDRFGKHAAAGRDVVAVGAASRYTPGSANGAVYVFRDTGTGPMGGWAEEAILTAPYTRGQSVTAVAHASVAGTEIVAAGSPGEGPNVYDNWAHGALYVFRRTGTGPMGGWVQEARLQQADVAPYDETGNAIALAPLGSGRLALAARSRRDVLVFERDMAGVWTETARLPVGALATYSDPDVLAGSASANGALVVSIGTGGIRVLRRGAAGWAQQAVLVPAALGEGERYGNGVAVVGAGEARGGAPLADDLVLVGSDREGNGPGGPVHVFRFDALAGAWVEEAAFAPVSPSLAYGRACALDVDAEGRALALVLAGGPTLHVFRRDAPGVWREVTVLDMRPAGAVGAVWSSWGGRAVSSSGGYASNGTQSGGAWVLDLRPALATAGEGGPDASALAVSVLPNPARGAARVTVTLAEASAVVVRVVDVLGREVAVALDGPVSAGEHVVRVDVASWPAGVYVVQTVAGAQVATARLVVTR